MDINYDKLSKKELLHLLRSKGFVGYSRFGKAELATLAQCVLSPPKSSEPSIPQKHLIKGKFSNGDISNTHKESEITFVSELETIAKLYKDGLLSDSEFKTAKKKLLEDLRATPGSNMPDKISSNDIALGPIKEKTIQKQKQPIKQSSDNSGACGCVVLTIIVFSLMYSCIGGPSSSTTPVSAGLDSGSNYSSQYRKQVNSNNSHTREAEIMADYNALEGAIPFSDPSADISAYYDIIYASITKKYGISDEILMDIVVRNRGG